MISCTKDCDSCAEGSRCSGCPFGHNMNQCKEAEKLKQQAAEMPCYYDAQERGL